MAKRKKDRAEYTGDEKAKQGHAKKKLDAIALVFSKPFALLIVCLLSLITFIFFDFLINNRYYLFLDIGSDSVNVFLPQLMHLSDYLRQTGLPQWSFREGMGQNYFPFSFNDPFMVFMALVPKFSIPAFIVYAESFKILLAGYFFFRFLKALKLDAAPAVIGAVLYAFSGFLFVGGQWNQFSYEAVYFALLLWSLELFFRNKAWMLFTLTVMIIAAHQPFNLFFAALLTMGYTLVRHLLLEPQPIQKLFLALFRLGLLGFLGAGMAGVLLLSSLQQMLQSPRGAGDASYFHSLSSKPVFGFADELQYLSIAMRALGNDLIGNGNDFKGFQNYLEAPTGYIGLVSFILAPQVFVFLDSRRRRILAAILLIAVLPLIFPYFRNAIWLFSGDYFRAFSLFQSILLLLMALFAMQAIYKQGKLSRSVLAVSLVLLLLLLYFPWELKDRLIDSALCFYSACLLVCYAAISLMLSNKLQRDKALVLLLLLLLAEVGLSDRWAIMHRKTMSANEWKAREHYQDHTLEALSFLNKSDSGFYRIIKDYNSGPAMHGSLNDAKVQGFNGTSSYNPFPQKHYIEFLQKTGVIEQGNEAQARWAPGLFNRTLLQPVTTVKYLLSTRPEHYQAGMGYDSIATFDDVNVFKNRYFLPLGYTYDRYIPEHAWKQLPLMAKDKTMLTALVTSDDDTPLGMQEYLQADTSSFFSFQGFQTLTDSLKKDTLCIEEQSPNYFKGHIHLDKKKMLFLSIPYDAGWTASVDGKAHSLRIGNIGFMYLPLDSGMHQVELSYRSPLLNKGAFLSALCIAIFAILFVINRFVRPIL